MGFVDAQALGLLRPLMLEGVPCCGGWVPESGVVGRRDGQVLGHVLDPGRQAVDPFCCGQLEGDLDEVSENEDPHKLLHSTYFLP